MLDHNLKKLPLEQLLALLDKVQRNLALSSKRKDGAVVIEQNKKQLNKVMEAIIDKRQDPLPLK